jgi:hypothetical protein
MATEPENSPPPAIHEQPLDDAVTDYLLALARQPPCMFQIRADSEHMIEDLEAAWEEHETRGHCPSDIEFEDGKLELWHIITGLAYPLLDSVKAHYAFLTIYTGAMLKPSFVPGDGLALFAVFDATEKTLRHRTMLPREIDITGLEDPIEAGLVLTCQPVQRNYYRRRNIVDHNVRHQDSVFRWIELTLKKLDALQAQRLLLGERGEMEAKMLAQVLKDFRRFQGHFYDSFKKVASGVSGYGRDETFSLALAPGAYFLERRFLGYGADARVAPDLRTMIRSLAQELKALYPAAMVEDAAFTATARVPIVHGANGAALVADNLHRPSSDHAHEQAATHNLAEPEPEM